MSSIRQVGGLAEDLVEDQAEDQAKDQAKDRVEGQAEDRAEDQAECLHLLLLDHNLPRLVQTYRRHIFCNHREK